MIKKRSGQHERTIREFVVEAGRGIHIGSPLHEFQGVLTGTPVFLGQPAQILQSSAAVGADGAGSKR